MIFICIWDTLPADYMTKNVLWSLMLLKPYGTEAVNEALTGVHRKNFRRCAWIFIYAMADLPTVGWRI